jgi:hypothetical protein
VLTVHHGGIVRLSEEDADDNLKESLGKWPFEYMFRDLQDDPQKNLLPELPTTVSDLQRLGMEAMLDRVEIPGVRVPVVYTFLGQFIDHDITLMDDRDAPISLANPTPLGPAQIKKIVNARSPNLDLDNVYGPNLEGDFSPTDPDDRRLMRIDRVKHERGLPKGVRDVWHDLPRLNDLVALIGDPRDDENLILAQLHVAFLRAHNAIVVERNCKFEEAQKLLIQHYQWLVLDDFLEQICDPGIVKTIRYKGQEFFKPTPETLYMPLEFSVAAYRFGHSKVRASYDQFNSLNDGGGFGFLFRLTQQRLSDDWVISWPSFLGTATEGRLTRRIDTTLASPLLYLKKEQLNGQDPGLGNLAVRNLLRGYIFRMPTGQAVAEQMISRGIYPLTPEQIMSVTAEIPVYGNKTQTAVLKKLETNFFEKTPLWFYILAEAAFYSSGYHLGPVGSTIVAEVLIGILRNSTHSILAEPNWKPTLGETPGKFDIEDLLKLARVL